jgi:hypothetical protein
MPVVGQRNAVLYTGGVGQLGDHALIGIETRAGSGFGGRHALEDTASRVGKTK